MSITPRVQWMNSMLVSCFGKWIDETRIKEDTELRSKMNAFLNGKSGQVFLVYCQKPYKINERGERVTEPNGIYQIYINEGKEKFKYFAYLLTYIYVLMFLIYFKPI